MIKMLAIKAVVKNGLIKPLEATDLPEGKEVVIYVSEEKGEEEYSEWTDDEWQRFSLRSFMNTEDDEDVDWVDFFNVEKKSESNIGMFAVKGIYKDGKIELVELLPSEIK